MRRRSFGPGLAAVLGILLAIPLHGAPAAAKKMRRGCPKGTYNKLFWPRPKSGKITMNVPWSVVSKRLRTATCRPCPKGAVTVRSQDGSNWCVGGKPDFGLPGQGLATVGRTFQPWICVPCAPGERAAVINGSSICVGDDCPAGTVPVPVFGPVRRYECLTPMEDSSGIQWDEVLPQVKKPRIPRCLPRHGLDFDPKTMSYKCQACGKMGLVMRNGWPFCGRNKPVRCRPNEGSVRGLAGQHVACAPCPKGYAPRLRPHLRPYAECLEVVRQD